jgi:hypothetical protein
VRERAKCSRFLQRHVDQHRGQTAFSEALENGGTGLISCSRFMPPNHTTSPARIFVSCGQTKNSDEIEIAAAVVAELKLLGFEPWLAVENQTLKGIQEFVFDALQTSEYFILLDFRRERIGRTRFRRGSLFSHQELAIASFLGIELLAFRESETTLEGLLSFVGGNAKIFDDRKMLPNMVADAVRDLLETRKWSIAWRNELLLERDSTQYADAAWRNGDTGRYFQIMVRNRHPHKVARNCYAYLQKATRLDSGLTVPLNTFELKWDGFVLPYANVLPLQFRRFDAACVAHSMPSKLTFSMMFSDAPGLAPNIEGKGQYELTYVVLSSNSPPARASFILNLDSQLSSTTLLPK